MVSGEPKGQTICIIVFFLLLGQRLSQRLSPAGAAFSQQHSPDKCCRVLISRSLLMTWATMIAYPVQLLYADSQGLEEPQGVLYTDCHALFAGQWADLQAEESRQAASAGSVVPFTLDLAGSLKRKAVSSRLQRYALSVTALHSACEVRLAVTVAHALTAVRLLACMARNVCVVYKAGKRQLYTTLLVQLM